MENKTSKKGIQTPRNSKNCRAKVTHCIPNKTFIIWKSPVRKVKIYANLDCLTKTILTEKLHKRSKRKKAKSPGINRLLFPPFFQTIVFCSTHFFLYNFSPFFPFLQFPLHWVFQFSNIKTNAIFRKTLISFFVFSVQEDEEKRGGKVFFSYLQIWREIIKMKSFFLWKVKCCLNKDLIFLRNK